MLLRKARRKLKSAYVGAFGLGYVKRRITGGPIQGSWLIAAKRVWYSKYFWDGTYEEELCRFIQKTVAKDWVCYDIGANIGYHALVMAKSAAEGGLVYAFEPLVEARDILASNLEINNVHNVVVVGSAVSHKSGSSQLAQYTDIDQSSLMDPDDVALTAKVKKHPLRRVVTCDVTTVDDFVAAGSRPPSLIKLDVEGGEVDVLGGATNTLKTHKPAVLCETHGRERARAVYALLMESHYQLFSVGASIVPINAEAEMPSNMHEGHVFAVRGDQP
jgi:FkbM family methyltransferase